MKNGKRYLITIKQENNCFTQKLAYWFDERITEIHTYPAGFYQTEHFYNPYKEIINYVDMDKLSQFYEWEIECPVENERYLVYRVGQTRWYEPHYTIRKFHNGSFGSKDVKYWIKLSKLLESKDEKN